MGKNHALAVIGVCAALTFSASAQSVVAPISIDPAIARLQDRVDDLERQLRQATGDNERLQRERDLARADVARLEKLVNDLLAEQAAAQAAAQAEPAPASPSAAKPPGPAPKPTPAPKPAPPAATQTPGTAGPPVVEPAPEAAPPPAASAESAAAYRAVRLQLMRGDAAGAEAGLRQWIEQYPADPLAPEAKYWLGQTLLGRSANEEAAKVFVELLRSHTSAPIAPDAMGRLGVALTRMGQKAKGCAAFADVARRFPNAAPAVKARAREEASKANCPAG